MANINVIGNNTVLIDDADGLLKECKNPEELQERVRAAINGVEVENWTITPEQRKAIREKKEELFDLCMKAHVPLLCIAQVEKDDKGPTFSIAKTGSTNRSAREFDIMTGLWMLLMDGEGKVRKLEGNEYINFVLQFENFFLSRMLKKQDAAETAEKKI